MNSPERGQRESETQIAVSALFSGAMMEHRYATDTHAAERYLLGELSAEEKEDFEAHFFECSACADEVRTGAAFIENARAVLKDEAAKESLRSSRQGAGAETDKPSRWRFQWWTWWRQSAAIPLLASLVLAVVAGYQNLIQIPGLRQQLAGVLRVQPVASLVLPPGTRGDGPVLVLQKSDQFAHLTSDLNSSDNSAEYMCELQDFRENVVFRQQIHVSGPTLHLLVPVHLLSEGRYTLIVRRPAAASRGEEIERSRFTIQTR